MSDIFLSYSREDLDFARKLAGKLEEFGWSVWWDKKIPAGKTFAQFIKQHLDDARCVIVIWSAHSVQSDWVANEAAEGARRKILAPVIIENAEVPFEFQRIQALNLSDWDGTKEYSEFAELVVSIQDIVPLPDTGEEVPSEKIVHSGPEHHAAKVIMPKKVNKIPVQEQVEEPGNAIPEEPATVPLAPPRNPVNYRHVIAFIVTALAILAITYLIGSISGGLDLGELWFVNIIFWGFIGAFAYDFISRNKKSKKSIFITSLIFFILALIVNFSNRREYYNDYFSRYEFAETTPAIIYKSLFYSVPWGAVIGMIIFKLRRKYLRSKVK